VKDSVSNFSVLGGSGDGGGSQELLACKLGHESVDLTLHQLPQVSYLKLTIS
jgi:hypothetical protein